MTVWTIDAEPGIDGSQIGRELAGRLGIPVVDAHHFSVAAAVAAGTSVAGAVGLEHAAAGRLVRYGLVLGMATGSAALLARELERIQRCKTALARAPIIAAREPCVIVGRCAYAALADHPGARHLRIRAPRDWRARRLAADGCLKLSHARLALAHADRRRRAIARHVYGLRIDDIRPFHLVCDASRLSDETIIELALDLVVESRSPGTPALATA